MIILATNRLKCFQKVLKLIPPKVYLGRPNWTCTRNLLFSICYPAGLTSIELLMRSSWLILSNMHTQNWSLDLINQSFKLVINYIISHLKQLFLCKYLQLTFIFLWKKTSNNSILSKINIRPISWVISPFNLHAYANQTQELFFITQFSFCKSHYYFYKHHANPVT